MNSMNTERQGHNGMPIADCRLPNKEPGHECHKMVEAAARRAFTLIEILVVVLIILVLAGLMFPALVHAQRMARVRKARSEAADLAKAWESYWDTYQLWPYGNAWVEMDYAQVAILAWNNTNNIKFMTFSDRQLVNGFNDPWKKPYRVQRTAESLPKSMEQQYITRAYMVNARRYAKK
ncbi:MAG: prepilin-type N-terminal cleavage/methylation domain-containing protein [Verrucomicrobiota bacterium]|nr:prepilin-type N-terminal cleavage/methylation domain-containing protein [Verrucomicrobiota bacterium]